MWSKLPSHLRPVLGAALALGVGVAIASLTLSFFALREAAEDPKVKFGDGHAWLFPIGIDMALIFFEILLIGASMVRVVEDGEVKQYNRAVPFALVVIAAAGTLYFNGARVPAPVRPIALAVPVASILVTAGLAYLLKMLTVASGTRPHVAPAVAELGRPVQVPGRLHGELHRDPVGEMPWRERSEAAEVTGQTGHGWGSGGVATTKRQQIESYLDYLGPEAALGLGARKITNDLRKHGVDVSERYVKQALDDRSATPSSNGDRP